MKLSAFKKKQVGKEEKKKQDNCNNCFGSLVSNLGTITEVCQHLGVGTLCQCCPLRLTMESIPCAALPAEDPAFPWLETPAALQCTGTSTNQTEPSRILSVPVKYSQVQRHFMSLVQLKFVANSFKHSWWKNTRSDCSTGLLSLCFCYVFPILRFAAEIHQRLLTFQLNFGWVSIKEKSHVYKKSANKPIHNECCYFLWKESENYGKTFFCSLCCLCWKWNSHVFSDGKQNHVVLYWRLMSDVTDHVTQNRSTFWQ